MKKTIFEYRGSRAIVSYDLGRCIHASECVRGLPEVFDPAAHPWVRPDGGSVEALRTVVARCPTGALHIAGGDGQNIEEPIAENTVQITENGPLHVRGKIVVRDGTGAVMLEETRLALCRCGASNAKPCCDAQHRDARFEDQGELGTSNAALDEAPGDTLEITVRPNGPLRLTGRFRLVSASGSISPEMTKVSLCRCGRSANKPFCDGAHKQGFVAE